MHLPDVTGRNTDWTPYLRSKEEVIMYQLGTTCSSWESPNNSPVSVHSVVRVRLGTT